MGIDHGIDAIYPGLSIEELVQDNDRAKGVMMNGFHAAVAEGYYHHGHIPNSDVPADLRPGGSLVTYSDLGSHDQYDFENWMHSEPVNNVTSEALTEANRAYSERDMALLR
jgi:hypothetical protein